MEKEEGILVGNDNKEREREREREGGREETCYSGKEGVGGSSSMKRDVCVWEKSGGQRYPSGGNVREVLTVGKT